MTGLMEHVLLNPTWNSAAGFVPCLVVRHNGSFKHHGVDWSIPWWTKNISSHMELIVRWENADFPSCWLKICGILIEICCTLAYWISLISLISFTRTQTWMCLCCFFFVFYVYILGLFLSKEQVEALVWREVYWSSSYKCQSLHFSTPQFTKIQSIRFPTSCTQ